MTDNSLTQAKNIMDKSLGIIRTVFSSVPSTPIWIAFGYLVILAFAEVLTNLITPRAGMAFHGIIIIALLLHASLSHQQQTNHFLLALALAPLIRLLSLALPLIYFPMTYRYAVIGVPLFFAAFMVARASGLKSNMIGLHFKWSALPVQLLIGIFGIALGFIEFQILRPDPLVTELRWETIWAPSLILLVFTGLLEEIIFRGLMQTSSLRYLGRMGVIYIAVLFSVMHLGYRSILDILFVFFVALLFGFLTSWSNSLLGVSLSHGLTNISLYLVFPFLLAAPAAKTSLSTEMLSPVNILSSKATPSPYQQLSPALMLSMPPALSNTPSPNLGTMRSDENYTELKTASPPPTVVPSIQCGLPFGWMIYIVQPGITLSPTLTRVLASDTQRAKPTLTPIEKPTNLPTQEPTHLTHHTPLQRPCRHL